MSSPFAFAAIFSILYRRLWILLFDFARAYASTRRDQTLPRVEKIRVQSIISYVQEDQRSWQTPVSRHRIKFLIISLKFLSFFRSIWFFSRCLLLLLYLWIWNCSGVRIDFEEVARFFFFFSFIAFYRCDSKTWTFERFRYRFRPVGFVCFIFHATARLILLGEMILDRFESKLFKVEKLWSRLYKCVVSCSSNSR